MALNAPSIPKSPPPATSPTRNTDAPPSLSTLVTHFVAARRSLACVEQVSQANNLVSSAKQAIEAQAGVRAQTLFIKSSTQSQLKTLDRVSQNVTGIRDKVRVEWDTVVDRVERARAKLQQTMETLQQTRVETKLQGLGRGLEEREDVDDQKHLIDFVDDGGLSDVLHGLDDSGLVMAAAIEDFDKSIITLVQHTREIYELLDDYETSRQAGKDPQRVVISNVDWLQAMEATAEDMANNMESLISHYDLCEKALKHTEGGLAAFKSSQNQQTSESLAIDETKPLEEISNGEMEELRALIEKDAPEVEDVVAEIKAGLNEVQMLLKRINGSGDIIKIDFDHVAAAFHQLEDVGSTLPGCITQSQLFAIKWEAEQEKIEQSLADLQELRNFYVGFIDAYDNLLIEVGRRKDVEKRINKIRNEAMAQINQIQEEEHEERQAFKDAHGDYLPIDIWPSSQKPPSRYEFVKVDETGDSVPDISASIINRAIKRVSRAKRKQ